jgi:hypothetical protein
MSIPVRGFTERQGPDAPHQAAFACHYLVFPITVFSCFPTHLQMWTMWPEGPEQTQLGAWGIVGPTPEGMADDEWQSRSDRNWSHFVHVAEEDARVINAWKSVAHSRGFTRNMFNTAESRLTAFHREVNRRVGVVA